MLKIYCDCCGQRIDGCHRRVMQITTQRDEIICREGIPIVGTSEKIDLCVPCACKLIEQANQAIANCLGESYEQNDASYR